MTVQEAYNLRDRINSHQGCVTVLSKCGSSVKINGSVEIRDGDIVVPGSNSEPIIVLGREKLDELEIIFEDDTSVDTSC